MRQIVRYTDGEGLHVGLRVNGTIHSIPGVTTMAALLRMEPDRVRALLDGPLEPVERAEILPPIDERTEVWGGGVTYERSRVARIEESDASDVYDHVYAADRPELFFKSASWRVRTDGQPIAIRADSFLNVPEPELALWIGSRGDILGYLVCNDMTSRSIEAENPLYLPQAKVYAAACALSDGVVPVWDVPDPMALEIRMRIARADATVWEASTSTSKLRRSLPELVSWLTASLDFPDGVVLSTGTGIVPEMDFVLQDRDVVEIDIAGVGTLRNTVVSTDEALLEADTERDTGEPAVSPAG